MHALRLSQPAPIDTGPLELVELEPPRPKDDEVLLRVHTCGLCRTDLHVVEGELPVRHPHVVPGHQVVAEVVECGSAAQNVSKGTRVGVAWLHRTCGVCRFCRSGRENLCVKPEFTGWTVNGGYAQYITAPAHFVYPLPGEFSDTDAAPLLCAGIIGYRTLRLCGIDNWRGARLGIYGFGAAGHIVIQLARYRGAEVYVCTRDRSRHQALASELGAKWVGDAQEPPPVNLDAAIIFAPAGELVPPALAALNDGGTLVLGGIYMSPIPQFDYALLYRERVVRSAANNTRQDGREFLDEAVRAGVHTRVTTFPLADANRALSALKHDAIRGAGVLLVS